MGKVQKTTWPKGYLARVLARIRENREKSGGTFKSACWRICFFRESNKDPVRARRIERAIKRLLKRERKIDLKQEDLSWQEKLEHLLHMPFNKLLADAEAHEKAFSPHVED